MSKRASYYFGIAAEIISSLYLRIMLYSIIARRFKSPFGEIDIIAKKGKQLVFLEIKARKDTSLMDFISKNQQKRIIKTSEYFLLFNPKYRNYNIKMPSYT